MRECDIRQVYSPTTYGTLLIQEKRVWAYEENKRHCEAAKLVYTKTRGWSVSQGDLHYSANPPKNLLQLVEQISKARPRRIGATIQEAPHHSQNIRPNNRRDHSLEAEERLVHPEDSRTPTHARQTSRTHDCLQGATFLRPEQTNPHT